ncbi:TetR family transcriptional regulator [Rhizobium panacihumi]|uniref:TetR family transcriptional regulator n=1 Tax=Rhizobium panacihumi TaxID=2008450 RepID=UPI003D7ADDA0
MGPRKIDPERILDAAERVISRTGAASLSIDSVAKEAGVSKSQVVYDHKTKCALLEALVERQIRKDQQTTASYVSDCAGAGSSHAELFGRLVAARTRPHERDRAIAMAVSVSLGRDERLQQIMRNWMSSELAAVSSGPKPKAARMAYFALTGFSCIERFNFHTWTDAERTEILEEIRDVYTSYPA